MEPLRQHNLPLRMDVRPRRRTGRQGIRAASEIRSRLPVAAMAETTMLRAVEKRQEASRNIRAKGTITAGMKPERGMRTRIPAETVTVAGAMAEKMGTAARIAVTAGTVRKSGRTAEIIITAMRR